MGRPIGGEKEKDQRTGWATALSAVWGATGILTVWVALAELFTEILSHDAGAGAVAGAVRVVTGLVVVHLCGVVV